MKTMQRIRKVGMAVSALALLWLLIGGLLIGGLGIGGRLVGRCVEGGLGRRQGKGFFRPFVDSPQRLAEAGFAAAGTILTRCERCL